MAEVANPVDVLPPAPAAEDTYEDDTHEVDGEGALEAAPEPAPAPASAAPEPKSAAVPHAAVAAAAPPSGAPATPPSRDRSVASSKQKANCTVFDNAPARATVRTKNYPTRPQDDKKFSFTACPNSHTARPHVRADFSHSSFETRKITEDNGKLCKRLMEISTTHTGQFANNLCPGASAGAGKIPANMSAAAVNRRKSETKIAQENLAIYKRLQAIKPSKDISRNTLGKDFEKSRGYMNNARKLPDGGAAAARKSPEPGHSTATAPVVAVPAPKPAAAPVAAPPLPPKQTEPHAAAVTGEDVPEARPSAEAATVPEAALPPPEPAPAPPAGDDDAVEEEDIDEEV